MKNLLTGLLGLALLTGCASSTATPSASKDAKMSKTEVDSSLKQVDSLMSPFAEDHIGVALLAEVLDDYTLWYDPTFSPYLQEVTSHVSIPSMRKGVHYTSYVVQSDLIFAFGLPGGSIFVSTGLLNVIETEDALACVLGVEIANIEQQYLLRLLHTGNKDASFVPSFVSREDDLEKTVDMLLTSRFTDDNVNEAERLGMIYAQHFGYNPQKYNEFLAKLFEADVARTKPLGVGLYDNGIVSHRQSYGQVLMENITPHQEMFPERKDRYKTMKKHL